MFYQKLLAIAENFKIQKHNLEDYNFWILIPINYDNYW